MTQDEADTSLEERIREYLTRFPHRDTDMSKYGVCRDWLISVIQAEAERCAKIASEREDDLNKQYRKGLKTDIHLAGMSDGAGEVKDAIRSAYGLDGKVPAVKDSTGGG